MSAVRENTDIPRGMPEVRQFNFAQPSAINVNVRGTDARTGLTDFTLTDINSILRAIVNQNLAATLTYEFDITRDGYVVYTLPDSLLRSDQQFVPEVFPLNLRPGVYQIQMRQTAGSPAARTLIVTFQTRLVPVG